MSNTIALEKRLATVGRKRQPRQEIIVRYVNDWREQQQWAPGEKETWEAFEERLFLCDLEERTRLIAALRRAMGGWI